MDVPFNKACFKHDTESETKGIRLQFCVVNNKRVQLSVVQKQEVMVYGHFCNYKYLALQQFMQLIMHLKSISITCIIKSVGIDNLIH
jgi:hypothetical protein